MYTTPVPSSSQGAPTAISVKQYVKLLINKWTSQNLSESLIQPLACLPEYPSPSISPKFAMDDPKRAPLWLEPVTNPASSRTKLFS